MSQFSTPAVVGNALGTFHLAAALMACDAARACASRVATTPRKLPLRTTLTTPGMRSMGAVSSEISRAVYAGGRTT